MTKEKRLFGKSAAVLLAAGLVLLAGSLSISGATTVLDASGATAQPAQPTGNQTTQPAGEDDGHFVVKGSKTYYYRNGKKLKGLQTIDGSKYYFSKKGVMAKKCFKTVKGKKYYFGKNGKAYVGLRIISKNLYYFDDAFVMQEGWQTVGSYTYYFLVSGKAVRGRVRKLGQKYAFFDENGHYLIEKSYCLSGLKKMQVQYLEDPVVSDETLLAAILYAEAGGETQSPVKAKVGKKKYTLYEGQLAVGYTILNRLESTKYPDTLKEVIYAQYQFEPARTGRLTYLLNNPGSVSSACKNCAKIILSDYNNRTDSVTDYPRSEFLYYNFWALGYAQTRSNFFSVYREDEYNIIGNQVFFNYTKLIQSYS